MKHVSLCYWVIELLKNSSRELSKVEKQLCHAKEASYKTIDVGNGKTEKEKRLAKFPKKYPERSSIPVTVLVGNFTKKDKTTTQSCWLF